MPEIVLGGDVPHLLVILQSGATNIFALSVQVEPADLTGVDGVLKIDETEYTADLTETTYTWTFSVEDVDGLTSRSPATLSLVNMTGRTLLGRGIIEIRS